MRKVSDTGEVLDAHRGTEQCERRQLLRTRVRFMRRRAEEDRYGCVNAPQYRDERFRLFSIGESKCHGNGTVDR